MSGPSDKFRSPSFGYDDAPAANPFDKFDGTPVAVDWSQFKPAKPEGMIRRLGRGIQRTVDAGRIAATNDPNEIAGIISESERNKPPATPVQQQMASDIAPYVEQARNAKGVVDNVIGYGSLAGKRISQFASHPKEFAGMVAENLPNSVPGIAAGLAGAAGGMSVAGPVGAVVGGVAGGTAGGYMVEQGSSMQDQVLKEANARGIDTTDQAAITALVKEKYPEFLASSRLKGVGTAGTDAILNVATLGLAGAGERVLVKEADALSRLVSAGKVSQEQATRVLAQIEAKNTARNTLKAKVLRGSGIAGAEMAGEGFSEGVGQQMAYGSVDPGDVVDESLLGFGTGVGMAAGHKAVNRITGVSERGALDASIKNAKESVFENMPAVEQVPPGAPQPPAAQADTVATDAQAPANGMGYNPEAGQMTEYSDGSQSFASEVPDAQPPAVEPSITPPTPEQAAEQLILEKTGGNPGPLAGAAITAIRSGITPVSQVQPAMSAFDQREADRPRAFDGDIATTEAGAPLTNRIMAGAAARKKAMETGQSWQPIELGAKKFVIRPVPQDVTEAAIQPAASMAAKADPGADILNKNGQPFVGLFDAKIDVPQSQVSYSQSTLAQQAQPISQPEQAAITPEATFNAQYPAQGTEPTPAQVAGEASQAVAGDAAAAERLPAARSGALEGGGVAPAQVAQIPAFQQLAPVAPSQSVTIEPGQPQVAQQIPTAAGPSISEVQAPASTVYFSNPIKAAEFIRKNGLKDTHQSVKTNTKRWDIQAKDAQPKADQVTTVTADQAPKPVTLKHFAEQKQAQRAATPKPSLKLKMEAFRQERADYFTPGNIVQSYSGHDRVVSYQAPDAKGEGWSVTVQAVVKQDGQWIVDPKDTRIRTHSTHPDKSALATGPVVKAPAVEQVPAKIEDVGEKIGGARKDTAGATGPRLVSAKEQDDRPTWAKRFQISQIAGGFDISVRGQDVTGKWTISDTRNKDRFDQPKQMGSYFNTKEEAEAALPLLAVAQKHRVTSTAKGADGEYRFEIWRDISDRKRVKVVDKVFDTRIEAMEYFAKNAQAILETSTTFGEADLPKPESTTRVGVERRTGDVKGEDFQSAFGFRGVEFGNWNNQDERQEVMNEAYDGLMDLAEVMGVPPKAIGLNGDLALAFGARGQGLNSARAHYERNRAVMNLTKMNGAGALAHEWFHALDHYLGRQDGKASAQWKLNPDGTRSLDVKGAEDDMASGGFRRTGSGVRQELRDAYTKLIQSLFYKAEQYVDDTAKADKFVAASRGELEKQLAMLRQDLSEQKDVRYYKRNNKPASAEQLAEFDAIAAEFVEGRGLSTEWKSFPGKSRMSIQSRHTNDALEKLSEIYKAVRGRSGFDATNHNGVMDTLRQYITRYEQRLKLLADANNETSKTKNVPTNFAMDAKSMDQGRGTDYWTTPHEMAARAFQGYVEDMIAAKEGKSPFLNYAPENSGVLTPWGMKRPYPSGEERKAMNSEFDNFVGLVQTKETEQGVAMFSSKPFVPASMRTVARTNPQTIQKYVDGIAKVAKTLVPINVVANPGVVVNAAGVNLADMLGVNSANTGGAVVDGQIYLFTDNLRSMGDVKVTLFHELFHFGLRKVIPSADYVALMQELGRSSNIARMADKWKASPIGKAEQSRNTTSVYNAIAIEEALAETEEALFADGDIGTAKPLLIRQLLTWFSKVADKLGFDGMAQALRRMTMTDAEKFVNQMVRAALGGDKNLVATQDRIADGVFSVGGGGKNASEAASDGTAAVTNLKHKFGNRLADFRGLALQSLGRRQLVDIYAKDIPMLDAYSNAVAQMDADKNEAGADADKLVTDWAKLKDERQLAELMHDATRAQIDPSKPFVKGDDENFYDALKDGYDRLSPEAKAVYAQAREMYTAHHEKVRAGIKARIENSALSSAKRQALLEKMDGEFFKKTKGVYFPLSRFGQYLTIVRDASGEVRNVTRSETMNEAEETRRLLKKSYPAAGGFQVGKVLKAREFNAARDGVGRGFMEDLFQTLEKTGASEDLQESISQLYLASLPDLSWSKHGIHRKGTPGFSQDARRAFAQNMFHGGNYLAKLRFSDRLQSSLDDMQEHVDAQKDNEAYDSVKAQQVVDEMVKRHESLMNPKSNPVATALTSFGFVFHLGLSPASALVNLSQTALVAYPIMGSKWGFEKSATALLKASKETAGNKNDISKVLKGEELEAYNEAVRSGVIDVTMAHDLAGISQGEDANLSAKIRPVMKWASFMFHHAEKFNRQVTFVASYRLARTAGSAHDKAYADAVKATYDGHFDYSASNRARIMQGNVAKVVLLFKQYAKNMIYTLSRNLQQAIQAETPQERAQARKAISGLLVSHALAAGAFGLPLVGTLLGAASMIGSDEDEPWDAQVALQNMLTDTFGQQAAEVFAHGLSRLTPWDISGRVGLDKLLLPDIQEGLQGVDSVNAWMASALGPVAGIAVNVGRGMQEISEGRYLKGLESMMPTAVRGPLKALRYGTEGNVDKTGIVINDEVSDAGVAGQILGFSPSETRLAQEGKSAIYAADRAIQARRSDLIRQFAMAALAEDEEGKAEARMDITRFNQKNPSALVTPLNLVQSVRARRKRIEQAEQGVYLPMKRQGAMEAGRFAVAE